MVSIWILDKRAMAEGGASPAEIEAAAETSRRDAGALARLKHPAIIKVLGMPFFLESQCGTMRDKRGSF